MLELLTARSEQAIFKELIRRIGEDAAKGIKGQILLVPEQYSHNAERLLCAMCDDDICLYAQVLSFRRLATRVFETSGNLAKRPLDDGARLLTMAAALSSVRTRLGYFSVSGLRPEVCKKLLSAVKELKNAEISPEALSEVSSRAEGSLSAKLNDMALIYASYNALCSSSSIDADDELTMLADALELSPFAEGRKIYVAGFTDFTAQQLRSLKNIILSAESVTVGLTINSEQCVQKKTAARLASYATDMLISVKTGSIFEESERSPELEFFSDKFFDHTCTPYSGENTAVHTAIAANITEECALAAGTITDLARHHGWRMRDFIVTARGFEKYSSILSGIFEKSGISLYTGSSRSVMLRSEMLIGIFAARIVLDGYEYEDMFSYLKTGLAGLSVEETDILENYVLQWDIRGSKWTRNEDWHFNPSGKRSRMDEDDLALLERINALKNRVREPLLAFEEQFKKAETAEDFCLAIYELIETISLRETLQKRYEELYSLGEREQADEYRQLWDIMCKALDQFVSVAGKTNISAEEFVAFFKVLISDYSAGIIPVGVDSVTGCELTRLRGQRCKCLIILGATDSALPAVVDDSGVFSQRDKGELKQLGIELQTEDVSDLEREFDAITAALDTPENELYIFCPAAGNAAVSFVLERANKLFENGAIDEGYIANKEYLLNTKQGCFELACLGTGEEAGDAQRAAYNALCKTEDFRAVIESCKDTKANLTSDTVKNIYGSRLWLTPSRVEKFRSCKFSYFMQYGLKAQPRLTGVFQAQDAGTFMHYILQNVSERAKAAGGYASTTRKETEEWTREFTELYVRENLDGFKDKSARFVYLFERLARSAVRIVDDLSEELRSSSFEPLAFELNFGPGQAVPAIEPDGTKISITGIADRVDGWIHDGKLYLRIIDYKTGLKNFDLGDVWNGLSLQMLIYLFALQKNGAALFDGPIVPAGILYVPARDPIVKVGADRKPEKAAAQREKELRRNGLLIDDMAALRAMEHDIENGARFMPVSVKKSGELTGSIASITKLKRLSKFVDDALKKIGSEIIDGRVDTDPFFSGSQSACDWCDYAGSCRFEKTKRGVRRLRKPNAELFWQELEALYVEEKEDGNE